MDTQSLVVQQLRELTGKSHLYFFNRCDDAINYLLAYFKSLGAARVLIPDSGGWFSYQKLPLTHHLEIVYIKTLDSLIDVDHLESILQPLDIVLINAYGGYFVREPLEEIAGLCKKHHAFFINDACATIGTRDATIGDFIVCSTRFDKPLAVGLGGFLALTSPLPQLVDSPITLELMPEYYEKLNAAILTLSEKREAFETLRQQIIAELSSFTVLHPYAIGINVNIAITTPEEKDALIAYCARKHLDYVLCPNYIKVMRGALSIEVKRINFKNSVHYKKVYTVDGD